MARVLTWFWRDVPDLAAPEMVDRPFTAREHRRHRELLVAVLGVVVRVVSRPLGREETRGAPHTVVRVGVKALDRGLRDDGEVDPLRDVRHRPVDAVDDRRAELAR